MVVFTIFEPPAEIKMPGVLFLANSLFYLLLNKSSYITFVCIFTAVNNLKSRNDENSYSFSHNPGN